MSPYCVCVGCGVPLDDEDAAACDECREDYSATPYPSAPLPADDEDVIPIP